MQITSLASAASLRLGQQFDTLTFNTFSTYTVSCILEKMGIIGVQAKKKI